MEILAAYDLTGSYHKAAELVGCDHHTVRRYVALRRAGAYTTAVWASILGNVLVAEYFIVQRMLAPLARRQQRRDAPLVSTPV
ncbi:hypothetical protein [Streptosporangium subroseum]|nr:hypothetical protein [Streptosporangium subroseum]